MDKEALLDQFERNVAYLRKTVPPDDIYAFCEQTFMSSVYFIRKIAQLTDLEEECKKDERFGVWVKNIMLFQACKNDDMEIHLDLDLNMGLKDD